MIRAVTCLFAGLLVAAVAPVSYDKVETLLIPLKDPQSLTVSLKTLLPANVIVDRHGGTDLKLLTPSGMSVTSSNANGTISILINATGEVSEASEASAGSRATVGMLLSVLLPMLLTTRWIKSRSFVVVCVVVAVLAGVGHVEATVDVSLPMIAVLVPDGITFKSFEIHSDGDGSVRLRDQVLGVSTSVEMDGQLCRASGCSAKGSCVNAVCECDDSSSGPGCETYDTATAIVGAKWVVGEQGKSCDAVCAVSSSTCDQSSLDGLPESPSALMFAWFDAGNTCSSYHSTCSEHSTCAAWGAPYVHKDAQTACQSGSNVAPCSGSPVDSNHKRLCPCVKPVTSSWILGTPGQSCDDTCSAAASQCVQSELDALVGKDSAVRAAFSGASVTCDFNNTWCDGAKVCEVLGAPYVHRDAPNICQYGAQSVSACSVRSADFLHLRVCPCGEGARPSPTIRPTATKKPTSQPTLPTPAPATALASRAFGVWNPTKALECSKEIHDSFHVVADDGKKYPTWHPTSYVDPKTNTVCYFGHEHGDDPKTSVEFASEPMAFGYANEQHMAHKPSSQRDESHEGHKVQVGNQVQICWNNIMPCSGNDLIATCNVVIKVHQGTSSADAFTNNLHEVFIFVHCVQNGDQYSYGGFDAVPKRLQGPYGNLNAKYRFIDKFSRAGVVDEIDGCTGFPGPGIPVDTNILPIVPADSVNGGGARKMVDRRCVDDVFLKPEGQFSRSWNDVLEHWVVAAGGSNRGGSQQVGLFANPYMSTRGATRFFDQNKANTDAKYLGFFVDLCYETGSKQIREGSFSPAWCKDVLKAAPATGPHMQWNDVRSPWNGAHRNISPNRFTVNNPGPATVFYSDGYGEDMVTDPNVCGPLKDGKGCIKQFIDVGTVIDCGADIFLPFKNWADSHTHAPN